MLLYKLVENAFMGIERITSLYSTGNYHKLVGVS